MSWCGSNLASEAFSRAIEDQRCECILVCTPVCMIPHSHRIARRDLVVIEQWCVLFEFVVSDMLSQVC